MTRLLATAAGLELALLVLARFAPAMDSLSRTGMFLVAGGFAVAIWHAARNRTGQDRRQEDRRSESG